jgi:putative glycosyltransferase (TIGR04348 family)
LIVSPALKRENNGNWQTASRWAHFLRERYSVAVERGWSAAHPAPQLMIALHARRSAPALAAFAATGRPSILVLTGTDLYRDIVIDADARASLERATRLVVLQDAALRQLPEHLRGKTRVIYQSAPPLAPWTRPVSRRHYDISMVGHLRAEKDPLTFIAASQLLTHPRLRFVQIGGALDPGLGAAAAAAAGPHYRWLGSLPHGDTRQRIKRSHALAIPSRMEGGANVIIEALTCGVPVLASDIDGNRGMLGDDYLGYFPVGDAAALAALAHRSVRDPHWYEQLKAQCAARAPLFDPMAERAAVLALAAELLVR